MKKIVENRSEIPKKEYTLQKSYGNAHSVYEAKSNNNQSSLN